MRMKASMLLFALLLCVSMYAQSIKVQGKVTDDRGAAIPAATITTRDSKKVLGITANNGTFSVKVPSGEVLLIICNRLFDSRSKCAAKPGSIR